MTVEEILRQQLVRWRRDQEMQPQGESPDLTEAMIKVLLAKNLENYIPCSRYKGYTVDGQPLENFKGVRQNYPTI